MLIRAPTYADIEILIDLGAEMHKESAYAFLPYDRDKVRGLIIDYIEDNDTRCALIAENDGRVVGMIGGYLLDYCFCNERLVSDEVLFVKSDRRGEMTAIRLIRGLQQWAKDQGARELCLGISTNVQTETTGKFYERLGFTHVGGIYKKRLKNE